MTTIAVDCRMDDSLTVGLSVVRLWLQWLTRQGVYWHVICKLCLHLLSSKQCIVCHSWCSFVKGL